MSATSTARLSVTPPFDGAGAVAFLGRRAVPGVEEVEGGAYRRSLRLPRGAGVVELRPAGDHVAARLWLDDQRDRDAALARARALLDLDHDPEPVVAALGADPLLGPLVRGGPGRRLPACADGAEMAVRAVLGQQVSLAAAATHAARLVAAVGTPLRAPVGGVTRLFPAPAAVASLDPRTLAMPVARRRALLGLARALARGDLSVEAGDDHAEAQRGLLALPGIGPWTASYVAMRALRDADAFLPADLGVRHALRRLGAADGPGAALRLAERWRPFRAYAVVHLWAHAAT